MNSDTIYRYLGLAVVILICVTIALKSFNIQSKVLEGMTNININSEISGAAQEAIEVNDKFSLDTTKRKNYDDLIIAMDKNISQQMLEKVVEHSSDILNNKGQEVIEEINNLSKFKKSLNEVMIFVDST